MTNYKDFEINRKNGSSNSDERIATDMDCLSKITTEILSETIKNCEYTAGSGCTRCCNSKKELPRFNRKKKIGVK